MPVIEKIKASVNNYLKHLAAANKSEFGNEVPDCCKVNRSQNKTSIKK